LIRADVFTLLHLIVRDGRTELARRLYAMVRGERSAEEMRALLTGLSGKPDAAAAAAAFVERLEALVQPVPDPRRQELTS
jgi:hypothetical protein